jgi:aminoglycoside phosphotransferase (APT) family kinase protein
VSDEALADKLASAWQRHRGEIAKITGLKRLSAGAASASYAFTAVTDRAEQPAVLQLAGAGDAQGFIGALDKTVQARVQQRAQAAGVPTPEVLLMLDAEDGLGAGFVSARVDGETLGGRIAHSRKFAPARERLGKQVAGALARIHALPAEDFADLPALGAAEQLAELARLHRSFGEALPVFEAAIAWLGARLPEPAPPRLVHGDFRNGNFLVDPEAGLIGVLDWELAHRGDPAEDIGWLCMRSWRFGADGRQTGGFATRSDFLTAYRAAGGAAFAAEQLRFWEALAALKWGAICQSFAWQHLRGKAPGLEPALIGRRVSEVELHLLDLMDGREAA